MIRSGTFCICKPTTILLVLIHVEFGLVQMRLTSFIFIFYFLSNIHCWMDGTTMLLQLS